MILFYTTQTGKAVSRDAAFSIGGGLEFVSFNLSMKARD